MKLKIRISLCLLWLGFHSVVAQMDAYHYVREIQNVSGQWHKIKLPDDIFGKTLYNQNDIRIFSVNSRNDTTEVPYLLQSATEKVLEKKVPFTLLNTSSNSRGHYFTFETGQTNPVNEINLEVRQSNFDWRINLEGSNDQREWFSILQQYRIMAIKNERANFVFTKLSFPDSKYRYFRLFVNSREKPELSNVSITQKDIRKGAFRNFPVSEQRITNHNKTRQTEIEIRLQMSVPVSRLLFGVKDTVDYYRPISISYVTDSVKTEKGWWYNYRVLSSGILNSMEKADFICNSTVAQMLKVTIDNEDNPPLTIDSVLVEGYVHELVARFPENARYFLVYGNNAAEKPSYDLGYFADKIPEGVTAVKLDEEQEIQKTFQVGREPLFKNKAWLWTIMALVIILLGWFSIKMMRKNVGSTE